MSKQNKPRRQRVGAPTGTSEKIIKLVKFLASFQIKNSEDFLKLKQKIVNQLAIPLPSNVLILQIYYNLLKKKKVKKNQFFEKQLKKKPVRSLSGVVVISVLTKSSTLRRDSSGSSTCPGDCLFCPTEKNLPKSYLSGEPAVERAKQLKFNPYLQVKRRIETLEKLGHPTDKIELIIIGGSWSALPKKYQIWFIKECFRGANDKKLTTNNQQLTTKIEKLEQELKKEQKKNEKAKHRIIGITLETRPDLITPEEILMMRKLGCTRVEIGVQILDDKILKLNNRGHGIKEIIRATQLLKQTGLKVCYHLMFGLPFSSASKDVSCFKKIFDNQNFRPDMLKLYPCVITAGSKLFKLWQRKKYVPLKDRTLINLLVKIKSLIPPYVRVNRVVRDIPSTLIVAGSKISNLRELIALTMKKNNLKCRCIRCREVKESNDFKNFKLVKRNYQASQGKEIFLSFENQKKNKLVAFLRLRLQNNFSKYFPELKNAALIREVHTYGIMVPIGEVLSSSKGKHTKAAQHQGFGKKLIKEAEKIAKKSGFKKIAVIAGVGAREYYKKLGYQLENTYLIKKL